MSARDVLAASLWLIDREIAGAPLPHPSWETFRENDPETAMIYETQAGCHLAALSAAGYAVEQGWQPIETAPRDGATIWAWNGEHCQMEWYGSPEWSGWLHSDPLLSDADPDPVQPTHWRPLPAAPEAPR